ncbi:hypothetical protein Moror_17282 [Moniliophthora roreri MCA 2997]|uniref:Uncharacterized protein n=1 Tax=Moniliophthora roreri (strain MCA 2997) TaxID=1381753 RepID=V2XF77_MONRO|nr:hypothetical protein Moror_17282 [Moniliophthora roreri MCA 2997]
MFDIELTVVYGHQKIARFLEMDMKEMARRLRADLDMLKLPHPPEANIGPPSKGGITFFWTTNKNSVGHPLLNAIKTAFDSQDRPDVKQLRMSLNIIEILMKKGPDDGEGQRSPRPISRRDSASFTRANRSPDFADDSGFFERRHSSDSNFKPAIYKSSHNRPGYDHHRSLSAVRRRAIDDIESIQATLMEINDSCAIDETIQPGEDGPLPPRPAFLPQPPLQLQEESGPLMPVVNVAKNVTQAAVTDTKPNTPSRHAPFGEDYISLLPLSPEKPGERSYQATAVDDENDSCSDDDLLDFAANLSNPNQAVLSSQTETESEAVADFGLEIGHTTLSFATSISRDTVSGQATEKPRWVPIGLKLSKSDTQMESTGRPTLNNSTPGAQANDSMKTAFQLTRQFWDNRRELMALSARGMKIEKMLRELQDTPKWQEHDFFLGTEKGCNELRFELKIMEGILREETRNRQRAEMQLADVLRECKDPIIVPKLLEPFGLELS